MSYSAASAAAAIPHSPVPNQTPLTPRETEVLKLIAEGHSTKKIAGILGISFKTAACHRMHIMQKLDIHELASLVRYAIRERLVEA
jgi:DNA-binding NarL/FixJ family response regulator